MPATTPAAGQHRHNARAATPGPSRLRTPAVAAGLLVAVSVTAACGPSATSAAVGAPTPTAASPSPTSSAAASSTAVRVVATEAGLDGGRVWLVSGSWRQRVYQPRPLSAEDLRAEGLTLHRHPAPDQLVLADSSDVSFVVYPATGDGAALYALKGKLLHPLGVEPVDLAELERTTDERQDLAARVSLR